MSQDVKAFQDWTDAYKGYKESGKILLWPATTLIRMFKGNYIPGLDKNYAGKSVIDVGCGSGNNLVFLNTLDLKLYGTEVSDEICSMTMRHLSEFNINAELKAGFNTKLPFDDNLFDYLVSWNVIHYENNEDDMKRAIGEYARVLKPGGRIFISSTGPRHLILQNSKALGHHRYQIGRDDDFRKGEVFFYFDSPEYVKFYFSPHFNDVLVGTDTDYMFTEYQDYFLITGVKPSEGRP